MSLEKLTISFSSIWNVLKYFSIKIEIVCFSKIFVGILGVPQENIAKIQVYFLRCLLTIGIYLDGSSNLRKVPQARPLVMEDLHSIWLSRTTINFIPKVVPSDYPCPSFSHHSLLPFPRQHQRKLLPQPH